MIICLYIFHFRGFQGDDLITTCEDSTSDRENATIVKILFDIDLLQHCMLFCVYDTVLSVLLLCNILTKWLHGIAYWYFAFIYYIVQVCFHNIYSVFNDILSLCFFLIKYMSQLTI